RLLATCLAKYHFAPTFQSKANLVAQGILEEKILVTGNTVVDALLEVVNRLNKNSDLSQRISNEIRGAWPNIGEREFVLITSHRRENFGEGLENICSAIKDLAE